VGEAVQAFVRPEVANLARHARELAADQPHYRGEVRSLLFDGANSAVLLHEERTRAEFRIALPQTGRLADLRVGETVAFGFDPQNAVYFATPSQGH
jgi:spermidine/putrescine transport system ATP-binding protein